MRLAQGAHSAAIMPSRCCSDAETQMPAPLTRGHAHGGRAQARAVGRAADRPSRGRVHRSRNERQALPRTPRPYTVARTCAARSDSVRSIDESCSEDTPGHTCWPTVNVERLMETNTRETLAKILFYGQNSRLPFGTGGPARSLSKYQGSGSRQLCISQHGLKKNMGGKKRALPDGGDCEVACAVPAGASARVRRCLAPRLPGVPLSVPENARKSVMAQGVMAQGARPDALHRVRGSPCRMFRPCSMRPDRWRLWQRSGARRRSRYAARPRFCTRSSTPWRRRRGLRAGAV